MSAQDFVVTGAWGEVRCYSHLLGQARGASKYPTIYRAAPPIKNDMDPMSTVPRLRTPGLEVHPTFISSPIKPVSLKAGPQGVGLGRIQTLVNKTEKRKMACIY